MKIDIKLFIVTILIGLVGLLMMYSMAVAPSIEVAGTPTFYAKQHLFHFMLGLPIIFLAIIFPIHNIRQLSGLFFIFGLGLLVLTLVSGQDYDTAAKSWLKIGSFSFQPVEIAKFSTLIFLAAVFSSGRLRADSISEGLIPFLIIAGLPAILVMMQPDFGSFFVLGLLSVGVFFAAGGSVRHLLSLAGIFTFFMSIVIITTPYIQKRFLVFLDPSLDPLNTGFQVKQALIAIGSGGILGRGFYNSIQKHNYLPEIQSDTIFAGIAEEMGFLRVAILLFLFLYIAIRGFDIARNAADDFQRLLAVGITTWIVGQSFINIAVNLALFPNTGITLPLLSYGGTSMWITFAALGLLLNISQHTKEPARKKYRL